MAIIPNTPPLVAALAEWVKGNNSITAQVRAELEYRLQQFGYAGLNPAGQLALTPAGAQELREWGLA